MENENKISFEQAATEINKWLDAKRIFGKKREAQQSMIENLVDAVCMGDLVINEDNSLTQNLAFPIGNVEKIDYKFRIAAFEIDKHKDVIKGNDFSVLLTRTMLALTDQPLNVIRNLDSSVDRSLAESIAVFFVP